MNIDSRLDRLGSQHAKALRWFVEHAGTEQGWPKPLIGNILLASKAKGICKPAWSQYELSIRQTLAGPYNDSKPEIESDGSWTYKYFQENPNPHERDSEYTNRSLLLCQKDHVPVGVMIQTKGKPRIRYQILGIGDVTDWREGYFTISGITEVPFAADNSAAAMRHNVAMQAPKDAFDPMNLTDARRRITSAIVLRRGQQQFRQLLIKAYNARCAFSGCDATEALEAAHSIPYKGPETDCPANGLLLRADLHVLFDLGLIAIDSSSFTVLVAAALKKSSYSEFSGKTINLPSVASLLPSRAAIDQHRAWCGL